MKPKKNSQIPPQTDVWEWNEDGTPGLRLCDATPLMLELGIKRIQRIGVANYERVLDRCLTKMKEVLCERDLVKAENYLAMITNMPLTEFFPSLYFSMELECFRRGIEVPELTLEDE